MWEGREVRTKQSLLVLVCLMGLLSTVTMSAPGRALTPTVNAL